MQSKKPSRKVLLVWRARLVLLFLIPAFFSALFFSRSSPWWMLATGLWAAAFLYFYLFYYPIKYHKLLVSVANQSLLIRCGVIYTRIKAIPLRNITYVSLDATPLNQLLGLCTAVIFAPGGIIHIPGLTSADGQQLKAYLISHRD